MLIKPILRVHKDRHDSKSRQIVYHICYNVTYYMGPESAKLRRLKGFKFVPRLILKRGIRKCQYFDPKLPTFAVANSLPHISFM